MEKLEIEILNPKAKKLLEDMASLNLITINLKGSKKKKYKKLIKELKDKNIDISFDEITEEVEAVRKEMYEQRRK